MIERRRRFFRGDSFLDMPIFPPVPAITFNLHAYSKAQLALSSSRNWSLLHQPMPKG
jgi:hypothetical protein